MHFLAKILFAAAVSLPAWANICERSPQVQEAIIKELVRVIGKRLPCEKIGTEELRQVRAIRINNTEMTVFKPGDLAGLDFLEILDLEGNRLKSFPEDLTNFIYLRFLNLSHNHIDDTLPARLGILEYLEVIKLDHNRIKGHIPPSWGLSKKATWINVSHNRIKGTLPPFLSEIDTLQGLDVSHNNLEGRLPPEYGQMKSIKAINASHNNCGAICLPNGEKAPCAR